VKKGGALAGLIFNQSELVMSSGSNQAPNMKEKNRGSAPDLSQPLLFPALFFGRPSGMLTKKWFTLTLALGNNLRSPDNNTQHRRKTNMKDELITPDNLSKELLKSVLDAAYMETSFDNEGDIRVKEQQVTCFVFPNQERKDRVELMALFDLKPEASELLRLQAANRINAKYIIVRAYISNDRLLFTWDIPIAGGITKKAFVLAVKRFCSIPHDSVASCASDVVS
jgi:hypothetical protein